MKYSLKNAYAELQKLSEEIHNQELHVIVTNLLKILYNNRKSIMSIDGVLELHLSEALNLLNKYVTLGVDKPLGYEDLLNYVTAVKKYTEELCAEHLEMQELIFSSEASALLSSIKL